MLTESRRQLIITSECVPVIDDGEEHFFPSYK